MKNAVESVAERAWTELTARCTAFVVPEIAPKGPVHWIGSGTILQGTSGRVFILTARHVAEEVRKGQLQIGYFQCKDVLRNGIVGALMPEDGDIDVALLLLKRTDQDRLRPLSRLTGEVSPKADLQPQDALAICGYPSALERVRTPLEQSFTTLFYGVVPAVPSKDPSGRLRLRWGKDEGLNEQPAPPAPHGMSGGGLWRHRDTGQVLWTAGSTTTLVGVQSSWFERDGVAFVEPPDRWFGWFVEKTGLIDNGAFSSAEGEA